MKIGVPRETRDREFRVGVVPDGVAELREAGHEVLVEQGAGAGSGFPDHLYREAGARLVGAEEAFGAPDLVVKVKEPNSQEAAWLRPGQVLFCYLHLAAAPELTRTLLERGIIAIAYETMRTARGTYPVLAPMSEVAGRLAVQLGVHLLQKDRGGKGLLVGGVPGVRRGQVTVVGAGTVGTNAARVARALGAEVEILDVDLERLTHLYDLFHGELATLYSNRANLARSVRACDLLVGAVYLQGRRAPVVVTEEMVASMEPGSVIVDVAVDQGGCVETIRPTTHSHPTYEAHGVIHYGVANMPGAVPRTSTVALTNVTLPYVRQIADLGVEEALRRDHVLAEGLNLWRGEVTCPGVAESLGLPLRAA